MTRNRKGEGILIECKNGKISSNHSTLTHTSPHNFRVRFSRQITSKSLALKNQDPDPLLTRWKCNNHTQTSDINWEVWFDNYFKNDGSQDISIKNQHLLTNCDFIKKASNHEPTFADILMLGQLIDCKEFLGLEINLQSKGFFKSYNHTFQRVLLTESQPRQQPDREDAQDLLRKLALYELLDPLCKAQVNQPTLPTTRLNMKFRISTMKTPSIYYDLAPKTLIRSKTGEIHTVLTL